MKSEKKRKRIFEIYSENFSKSTEQFKIEIHSNPKGDFIENSGFYVCPTCLDIHDEESLDQNRINPLTLEDVPPLSFGGKSCILTCKKCNSTFGGTLDAELHKNLNISRLVRGDETPIKSTLNLGFGNFNSFLKYNKQKRKWHFIHKKNDYFQSKIKEIKEGWDGQKIEFQIKGGVPSLVTLAHIRIAYLKLFELFGYSYTLTKSGYFIINQLSSNRLALGESMILSENWFTEKEGVHLLCYRGNWFGFLIIYPLLDKANNSKKYYGVGLPGPYIENLEYFLSIPKSTIDLTIIELPKRDYLKNPSLIFSLFKKLQTLK